MSNLTERLVGKGTGQEIEYEQESVHSLPAAAHNLLVSADLKVKDNILWVMTSPLIALKAAAPSNPAARLLHTLLKAPNALLIKQVCILSSKLKSLK